LGGDESKTDYKDEDEFDWRTSASGGEALARIVAMLTQLVDRFNTDEILFRAGSSPSCASTPTSHSRFPRSTSRFADILGVM
jgi:hypothetical protein